MAFSVFSSVRYPILVLACVLGASPAPAQTSNDNGRKQAQAIRVANGAIRVDGRLDERAWGDVAPVSDFVQKEPVEGGAPTDRMEVRFAYDDNALYVGARMFSSEPIQSPLGRRDDGDQAEHFLVSLDTYLDRRTSSSFGVTASGVRLDEYFARDEEWAGESGYDPVWQARTAVDAMGWTAELWIPFSQLRFNDRPAQVWGLNVQRWVPTRNEEVYWSLVRRTEEGWASRFGDLHGISGIRPSRRLELLPYVASSSHLVGEREAGDPFSGGANLERRIGMDAKVGLGSNLTLEATVNPDFGQVEADPAEVNLSAFETFFDERRPFFTEGAELLTGNVNNFFYSRRIGAPPAGDADGDFVETPSTSTILGAAKLTGRLASGTSIGMLGAVTDDEYARTFTAPSLFGRTRVAPTTTYGVARLQQEFGPPGSTIGIMATGMHRNLEENGPLASRLTSNALTLSTDSVMRLRDGDYELQWATGMSYIGGAAGAIDRAQRASARYLQRPDAGYVAYDPTRTSMTGMRSSASLERRNGRHWGWEASTTIESPEFETNDIGRLTAADGVQLNGEIEYQETVPGRWWREYSFVLASGNEWNWGRDRQARETEATFNVTWPNFWQSSLQAAYFGRAQDMRLTRGGPLMQTPRAWGVGLEVETGDGSQTQGDFSTEYRRDEDGGLAFNVEGGVEMRPGPQWMLTISPGYEREVNTQQFVTALAGGGPATFGGRYIFGNIDRSTYSTELRVNYTFKPDLTLDFYGEPFAASGTYLRFGELAAAGTRALLPVDPATLRNRDFNVQSFRSNLVLRWEYRPGSTLYLVWQQDRETEETLRSRVGVRDMFSSFGARGDNFFAIKASFWFSPN
jgi:hypothetical protein